MKRFMSLILAAMFTAAVPFGAIAQEKKDCSKMADAGDRAKCEREQKQ